MAATLETGNRFNMGDNYHAHDLMQAKGWGRLSISAGPCPPVIAPAKSYGNESGQTEDLHAADPSRDGTKMCSGSADLLGRARHDTRPA